MHIEKMIFHDDGTVSYSSYARVIAYVLSRIVKQAHTPGEDGENGYWLLWANFDENTIYAGPVNAVTRAAMEEAVRQNLVEWQRIDKIKNLLNSAEPRPLWEQPAKEMREDIERAIAVRKALVAFSEEMAAAGPRDAGFSYTVGLMTNLERRFLIITPSINVKTLDDLTDEERLEMGWNGEGNMGSGDAAHE